MMNSRNITKSLAVMEDLSAGIGPVEQKRGVGTKINVPYAVDSLDSLKSIDTNRFTLAQVNFSNGTFGLYKYVGFEWVVTESGIVTSMLKTFGLSGKYGFTYVGMTLTNSEDLVIDEQGVAWKYEGLNTFPFSIEAGEELSADFVQYSLTKEYVKSFSSVEDCIKFPSHVLGGRYTVFDYYGGEESNDSGVLFFKVVLAGTGLNDGGKFIDIDDNYQLEQLLPIVLSAECYGVKDFNKSPTFDSTSRLQACLDFKGGSTYSSAFNTVGGGTVLVGDKTLRITDTIRHPEWVSVIGTFHGAISGVPNSPSNLSGSMIYADFTASTKTAWSIAGKWLKGAKSGEFIDLTEDVITAGDYDGGDITRQYGCKLSNIVLITDKEVPIGVGFAGAPSLVLSGVASHGFLNPIVGHSSWGIDLSVDARGGHTSLFMYNVKGIRLKAYLSKTTVTTPLNEETALVGWYAENDLHNPAAIRFLTTCLYARYTSALDASVVLESHERAIFEANTYGTTYTAPYIESIDTLPVHSVGSYIQMTKGRIFLPDKKFARVSSSGCVQVNVGAAIVDAWDNDSQESYGSRAQLSIEGLVDYTSIPVNETFSSAVTYTTIRSEERILYVSSTGSDVNTGLSELNAVFSLSAALDRLEYYSVSKIVVEAGHNVTLTDNYTLKADSNLVIQGSSTLTVLGDRFFVLNSAKIRIDGMNIEAPNGSSTATRGIFTCIGSCQVELSDNTINTGSSTGILVTGSTTVSSIRLVLDSVNLTGCTQLGETASSSTSKVKVDFNYSSDSVLSTVTFEAAYTVI